MSSRCIFPKMTQEMALREASRVLRFCQQTPLSPACPHLQEGLKTEVSCLQLIPFPLNHIGKCTFHVPIP